MPVAAAKLSANADIRSIVQGEALTITVELYDATTKQVLDLEGATDATASLPGTSATVEKTLGAGVTIGEDPGRLLVELDTTDTAALKAGEGQSWQVAVTLADGSTRIAQLIEQLDVAASLF